MKLLLLFLIFTQLSLAQDYDLKIHSIMNPRAQSQLLEAVLEVAEKALGRKPLDSCFEDVVEVEGRLGAKKMKEDVFNLTSDSLNFIFDQGAALLKLEELCYNFAKSSIEIKEVERSNGRVLFAVIINFSQTEIKAKKISINLNSGNNTSYMDGVNIFVDEAVIKSPNLDSLTMRLEFEANLVDGAYRFKGTRPVVDIYKDVTLGDLEDDLSFDFQSASSSHQIDIVWGGKSLVYQNEGLAIALRERKKNITQIILKPIVKMLHDLPQDLTDKISAISDVKIAKRKVIEIGKTKLPFIIEDFGFKENQQLYLYANFFDNKLNRTQKHIEHDEEIYRKIDTNDSDVIISLSENAINTLIATKLKEMFPENEIGKELYLGPESVRVKMNDSSQGQIVVDLELQPKWLKKFGIKLLTGLKHVRIPILIDMHLGIAFENGINNLNLSFSHGYHEHKDLLFQDMYGVDNSLGDIKRFKKTLYKKVVKILDEQIAKNSKELHMKPFDNINMEVVELASNHGGRFEAYFRISRGDHDKAYEFWDELPNFLRENVLGNLFNTEN